MSIRKQYLKTRPICKATFRLTREEAREAKHVFIVGEFNDWNESATPMKPLKNGGFVATLDLETGREYQFRYNFDKIAWGNDPQADGYCHSAYGNCENSILSI